VGFGVGVGAKRFALVCEDSLVTNVLTDDEGMDDVI
jgi:peroxiredoxin